MGYASVTTNKGVFMEDYDPYEAAAEAAHDEWIQEISQAEHDEIFFIPEDIDIREYNGEDE